jgi:hypothetical protein
MHITTQWRSIFALTLLAVVACDGGTIVRPVTPSPPPPAPITPAVTAPSVSGMKFNAAIVSDTAMPLVRVQNADSTVTLVEFSIEFYTDGTVSEYANTTIHFTQPNKDYSVSGRNHGAYTQVGGTISITNPNGGPVMERCTETSDGHTLDCEVAATRFTR